MGIKIKNVSVDIESWGTDPGDDIRSIGACLFDPKNITSVISKDYTFYIACDNPLICTYSWDHHSNEDMDFIGGKHRRYNLKRNPKTVIFWHDQPKELQDAFKDHTDLKDALIMFSDFLYSISEDIRDGVIYDIQIWSHGAAFDPPILKAAYIECGLAYPLFYRSPRDTRTVYDDAGIENHSVHQKNHSLGLLHHALYDSMSQASAISAAKNIIYIRKHKSEISHEALLKLSRSITSLLNSTEEYLGIQNDIEKINDDITKTLEILERYDTIVETMLKNNWVNT